MGMSHSTYQFFGVHVPKEAYQTDHQWREVEWLDAIIGGNTAWKGQGLGHVQAGDYDRDELFLCVSPKEESIEVELGTFRVTTKQATLEELLDRTKLLMDLIEAAGYGGKLGPVGWVTVPDCS